MTGQRFTIHGPVLFICSWFDEFPLSRGGHAPAHAEIAAPKPPA
jgi:hypothetical protein